MLIDCKAEYHGDQDAIQALGVLATDDQQTSLHDAIDTAYFYLVYIDHIIGTIEVKKEHYIAPAEDIQTPVGEFRVFFHHFQTRRGLHIRFKATLKNDETAQAQREVGAFRDKNVDISNPMLSGREALDWPFLPEVDYHRNI